MKKKIEIDDSSHLSDEHQQINYFSVPDRCCPELFPYPKLPSPTDCLPLGDFLKVIEKIRAANELLLNLALDDERPPNQIYQKVFDGFAGIRVEITNLLDETIEGIVTLVGFNFVALREEELTIVFPYKEIQLIKPYARFVKPNHDPELANIDPCFRRDLTYHFGEVVASSPELIQLFFRIHLGIYLLLFEGKQIQVKSNGLTIEGLLTDVSKETLSLKAEEEFTITPLEKITLITLKAENQTSG